MQAVELRAFRRQQGAERGPPHVAGAGRSQSDSPQHSTEHALHCGRRARGDSARGPRGYGSRAGPGAWGQLSRSRPGRVPLACTGAKDPLPWSGGHFEPLFSNPTFRLVSRYFCFRDLDRPSSRSKTAFVAGAGTKPAKIGGFLWATTFQRLGLCG